MPPKAIVTAEEDVKFLLTVIKHLSQSGSPNWQQVADELGLPSASAAQKRYSRMPGKYDFTMPKTSGTGNASSTPKKAKGPSKPKKAAASGKKRKIQEAEEVEEADDAEKE